MQSVEVGGIQRRNKIQDTPCSNQVHITAQNYSVVKVLQINASIE